jgi:hypothetical protein
MHKKFQPFLRSDGLGIDYGVSTIQNFDTKQFVKKV